MHRYRCFFLNETGQIAKAEIVEAESDEAALVAALKVAEEKSRYSAIEIWQRARKVFPQTHAFFAVKVGER